MSEEPASAARPPKFLLRIPVRFHDDFYLVPVEDVVSIVAEGELLHLTTRTGQTHTITHRLKELEARLDPTQFIRVSRGTLLNQAMIEKVTALPGGTYLAVLQGGAQHLVSRIRGRVLRGQLLRL